MNKNFEKSYQRFDSSIKKSAQNEFFADLINSIQGGNSVLAHKSINDFKVFTDDWVERIYAYLKQVEKNTALIEDKKEIPKKSQKNQLFLPKCLTKYNLLCYNSQRMAFYGIAMPFLKTVYARALNQARYK